MGEIEDYNTGAPGTSTASSSGDYNGLTGIRVAVLDSSGNLVSGTKVIDVISFGVNANHAIKVLNSHATKVQYKMGTKSFNGNEIKILDSNNYGSCPPSGCTYKFIKEDIDNSNYDFFSAYDVFGSDHFQDYTGIYRHLSNESIYDFLNRNDNLKKVVAKTGYNCLDDPSLSYCNSSHNIVVEAMAQYGDFSLMTGYEFTRTIGFNSHYTSVFLNMAKTIRIKPPTSITDIPPYGMEVCRDWLISDGEKGFNSMSFKTVGCGIGIYRVGDYVPLNPTLTINKYRKNTHTLITSSPAKFEIYEGENCQGRKIETVSTGNRGFAQVTNGLVDGGVYSIKEIRVPRGYEDTPGSCVVTSKRVSLGTNVVNVENTPGCEVRLSDLGSNPSKESLINLWKDYQMNNNLLNFNSPSCTSVSYDPTISGACLTASYNKENFNDNNWSGFTNMSKVTSGSSIIYAFCQTSFNLEQSQGYQKSSKISFADSGRLYFTLKPAVGEDFGTIMNGSFSKICYFSDDYIDSDGKYSEGKKISDYLIEAKLSDGTTDTKFKLKDDEDVILQKENNTKYSFKRNNVTYLIPEIFVTIPDGRPLDASTCNINRNCRSLGYGILSKLIAYGLKELNFSLDYKLNDATESPSITGVCNYKSIPKLVCTEGNPKCSPSSGSGGPNNPQKLNVEFRIIDTYYPFPGKSGNSSRETGSNWTLNQNSIINYINGIINNSIDLSEDEKLLFDFTDDGVVDESDLTFIENTKDYLLPYVELRRVKLMDLALFTDEEKEALGLDSEGNIESTKLITLARNTVKYILDSRDDLKEFLKKKYIFDRTNSFGIVPSGTTSSTSDPKYTITLTSDEILAIRNYNKSNNYDDYNISCSMGVCKSKFLDDLRNGYVNGRAVSNRLQ